MYREFNVPPYVGAVMVALRDAGHRGYLVGGSLRDLLRGVTPHDYDLTTDATPEEMLEIFKTFRVIPTGLKHGTVTVLSDGNPIEVTTHRLDGAYTDSRRPDCVSFTRKLEGDLSRRDFTVNAMAWNPETGLVDLFEGRQDLEKGILRAVGDPATRFGEDALRILRLFRFAAQLDFSIDAATLQGAAQMREGLAHISVERIFSEVFRMLEAQNAQKGLRALLDAGCGEYVFFDTVRELNVKIDINVLPPVAPLRLAALFPSLTREAAQSLARRWHASNAFCDAFCGYLTAAREPLPDSAYAARRFASRYWHYFDGALRLQQARGADVEKAQALCRRVARDGTAVELRRLAVNGKELQRRVGVLPAKTGAMLLRLQDLVWQFPEKNKRELLLSAAKEICEKEREFCE